MAFTISSKEVWKLNFQQYGQMEKHSREEGQPWRKSEGRRLEMEKFRDGESQEREDAGARKGREVATHSVFPVFRGYVEGRKVGSLKRRVRS